MNSRFSWRSARVKQGGMVIVYLESPILARYTIVSESCGGDLYLHASRASEITYTVFTVKILLLMKYLHSAMLIIMYLNFSFLQS